jgi:hypothetical protein
MGIESKKSRGVALSQLLASNRLPTLGALWGGGEWSGIGHAKANCYTSSHIIYTHEQKLRRSWISGILHQAWADVRQLDTLAMPVEMKQAQK